MNVPMQMNPRLAGHFLSTRDHLEIEANRHLYLSQNGRPFWEQISICRVVDMALEKIWREAVE